MDISTFGASLLPSYAEHSDLDEASAAVVNKAAVSPASKWWRQDIEASRADYASLIAAIGFSSTDVADHTRIDLSTAHSEPLPLHIYRPRSVKWPRCTMLFLRGSGMCMGEMALYDSILQRLCASSEALIVAPDYRLAPEHLYPAGHDDAYQAYLWLLANASAVGGDPSRVILAGDSAGAMLAVATALRAKNELKPQATFMILVAPALGTSAGSLSADRYSEGFLFDVADLEWLYKTYLGEANAKRDPLVYPILADDLSGLPPTLMITAGADIMRDDAENFLLRMKATGIPVELHREEGTIHPFFNMGGAIPAAQKSLDLIASCLKRVFT